MRISAALLFCFTLFCGSLSAEPAVIRSTRSGLWSAGTTWEGGKVPAAGVKVQIRPGHKVAYDVKSSAVIRSIFVAGELAFVVDKDTELNVGLIKIEDTESVEEDGFDCDGHAREVDPAKRPALLVGTPEQPIEAAHTAIIRLHYVDGMNKETCPAIVCCGGRMDFHGSPLSRTWVKLGSAVKLGDKRITLEEAVTGWRKGDRIIVTATARQNKQNKTFRESVSDSTQTEERLIEAVDGMKLTLDQPLAFDHICNGAYRGEIANLSRNVVVESAPPPAIRGHTMYHRNSAGAISYAEFRHLGKQGVLGKYSIHFHLVGDTMRGSYVVGASIWDSGNRWITIHGTNFLVVRDCVGYQSVGHGFFMEDGTEVYNNLDRNLAVQALIGKPLPNQVLPFDKNDGSGFWWANSRNSFTRNVAADCDEYGYFFQATKTSEFDPVLKIQQPDGRGRKVDIRKLPFIRFEDNEAHCQRRHAFNLGGGVPFGPPNVDGVGPDDRHPFIIKNFKVWDSHWAFHPVSPCVMVDGMDIQNCEYGVWRPVYDYHAYARITMKEVPEETQYAFDVKYKRPTGDSFPLPLIPKDDLPPATVITFVSSLKDGKLRVRGCTIGKSTVKRVLVNDVPAQSVSRNYAEWEVVLSGVKPGELNITAHAEDDAENVEKNQHEMMVLVK